MLKVTPHCIYDEKEKILYGIHESGFYSCINTTRIGLYLLISKGIIPETITFEKTLSWYKQTPNDNLYPLLYKKNPRPEFKKFHFESFCPTLITYNTINYDNLLKIENSYFAPSELVQNKILFLEKKYNINYSNTLAVLHRGNDKWREAVLKPSNFWIQEIEKKIPNLQQDFKILVQTDENKTKNVLVDHFKNKCFIFEEMIFNDTYVKPLFNFEDWAVTFESIMRIISKCQIIITHSGNCGFVPILYRGNTKNVVQLLHKGTFVDL